MVVVVVVEGEGGEVGKGAQGRGVRGGMEER